MEPLWVPKMLLGVHEVKTTFIIKSRHYLPFSLVDICANGTKALVGKLLVP